MLIYEDVKWFKKDRIESDGSISMFHEVLFPIVLFPHFFYTLFKNLVLAKELEQGSVE